MLIAALATGAFVEVSSPVEAHPLHRGSPPTSSLVPAKTFQLGTRLAAGRRVPVYVHGETIPGGARSKGGQPAAAPPSGPGRRRLASEWCGTTTARDRNRAPASRRLVKVVYARPAGKRNRFRRYADEMQADARYTDAIARRASLGKRRVAFDRGTRCGRRYLDIQTVRLPHRRSHYLSHGERARWTRVTMDLRRKLHAGASRRNYLVYADYLGRRRFAAGNAEVRADDRPVRRNANNLGRAVAVIWGLGGGDFLGGGLGAYRQTVAAHELTHTLGAVQLSAPSSTGRWHCRDVADLMCYDDGGKSTFRRCPGGWRSRRYDCARNDYFDLRPPPRSYLASHWNLADSAFLAGSPQRGGSKPRRGSRHRQPPRSRGGFLGLFEAP